MIPFLKYYFKLSVSWCAFLVLLRASSHFSAAIPHIYIFRTLLVSHKLIYYPHFPIFSYSLTPTDPYTLLLVFVLKPFSPNYWWTHRKWTKTENRLKWEICGLEQILCAANTSHAYSIEWVSKVLFLKSYLYLLIKLLAFMYNFPIQLPGLFAVRWWAHAAPTPILTGRLKKIVTRTGKQVSRHFLGFPAPLRPAYYRSWKRHLHILAVVSPVQHHPLAGWREKGVAQCEDCKNMCWPLLKYFCIWIWVMYSCRGEG